MCYFISSLFSEGVRDLKMLYFVNGVFLGIIGIGILGVNYRNFSLLTEKSTDLEERVEAAEVVEVEEVTEVEPVEHEPIESIKSMKERKAEGKARSITVPLSLLLPVRQFI